MAEVARRDRAAIAERLALDIPEGWNVNLGIGIPLLVANRIPSGREVMIHSENGILGVGPVPEEGELDPWLVNAGKQYVTLTPGASLFDHAQSFSMVRGGHIDLCVLGAFEVAANGDIANWAVSSNERLPAVGGAMDLAAGVRRLWVTMDHTAKDGSPKIVERCSYPLTALGAVNRIYTDLAVMEITERGVEVLEIVSGLTFEALQEKTGTKLYARSSFHLSDYLI
jgi:3-oxoadipate CoA-transferase beta subunit